MRKWLILFVCLLFLQNLASAEVIVTSVFNVLESQRTKSILVLSGADGRIYKAPHSERNLKRMRSFLGQVVKLSYVNNAITDIVLAHPSEVGQNVVNLNHFQYQQLRTFAPTDLQSLEAATEIFDNMFNEGDKRRSQCFKRAHIWTYDMWSKLGINSQKLFIFYTQRYIQLEDFEWWFHVAPMVIVKGQEYVLDGTFMDKPKTIKDWQSFFIKSDKVTCPVIKHYQEYEDHQWNRLCYLMKVPMHYFRPEDIQLRDKQGIPRNHWVLEELQDARRAFRDYDVHYEGLDTGKPTITH